MKKSNDWYKHQLNKICKEKNYSNLRVSVMPGMDQSEYSCLKEVYQALKNFDAEKAQSINTEI